MPKTKLHYDQMYGLRTTVLPFSSTHFWPRNRFEFAYYFGKDSSGTVLDVGCGDGEVLYSLRNHYDFLIGIEVSKNRYKNAEALLKDTHSQLFLMNYEDDSLPIYGKVDTVICLDVLDHFLDVRTVLKKIYDILKPGGQFILNIPNIAKIERRFKLLFGTFPSTSTGSQGLNKLNGSDLLDGGKTHYLTFSMVEKLLLEIEFKDIKKFGIGRYGAIHNWFPTILSGSISIVCSK